MKLKLSVLDYVPIDEGGSSESAMTNLVGLARRAEELGYQRYWVAEHHGSDTLASSSAEIVMTRVASATKRIRVGSGALLLPNYSSYRVAENYSTMAAMFPGRIDLGLGRSTGADGVVTKALNDEKRGFLPFEHKVDDLIGALTGRRPGETSSTLRARPLARHLPVPWILGSSGNTARMAAEAGLGFTFAHFINPGGAGARAAKSYRGAFRPSIHLRRPEVLVAVFVVIAETDKDVCALAKALHTYLVEVEVSEAAILPSPRTASQRRFSSAELARIDSYAGRVVVGTPQRALAQLQRIAADYGTDQLMVNPLVPTPEARMRALELLAEANSHR